MSIGNQLRTVILLGLLTGLLLFVGQLLGGTSGLIVALIFAGLMNFAAYWFSDKLALSAYGARQVTEKEHPRLHRLVREVVQQANVPMPRVYVLPGEFSNAFATGRNPKHAAVAFSQGILNLLNDSELKGVIAHEVAHIKNRDILISSIAATIAGVISFVASMAQWGALFGGFSRDREGPGIVEFLILAIVTPIIATLIQLAVSRSREFQADATGARFAHSGLGLASALEKLEADIRQKPLKLHATTESTAHMMIANPFGRLHGITALFSTHPSSKERASRLRSMTF